MERCSFVGTVSSSSTKVGGFAGYIYDQPSVFECCAVGTVAKTGSGSGYVGGFVGQHSGGFVADSYANVSVDADGAGYVGGFLGCGYGGSVSRTYCSGSVVSTTPNAYVGAFVGCMNSGSVTNSYYNSGATAQLAQGQNNKAAVAYVGIDPIAADGMKSSASFPVFDFEEMWNIDEGATMPFLRCFYVFEINSFGDWVADRNLPPGSTPDVVVNGIPLGARYVFGIDSMDAVLSAGGEPVCCVKFDENGKPYVKFAEHVNGTDGEVKLWVLATDDLLDWSGAEWIQVGLDDGLYVPDVDPVPDAMFFKWRIDLSPSYD